jgi:NAD(P)-dependent dehydrogenase (short-subunit alcohol dehydrogenase family)
MTSKTRFTLGLAALGAGIALKTARQRSRERDITGNVVLITGGSRGLGLALALRFAAEGCRVAICARDLDELERAKQDLARHGSRIMAVVCDVTQRSEVDQMIHDVTSHFGPIDILVNNAGQIQVGPLQSMSLDDFQKALDVMFWGTVYPTLTLLPSLLARNDGHIVNITSIGGKVAVPHLLPYTSAKSAAVGFSEGLHAELFSTGVRVTTIVPGLMRTGSYNAALFKGNQEAESQWFSLGASLPGVSMSADRAAHQIVCAVKRGDPGIVLSLPAKILVRTHGLAPAFTESVLGMAARALLPSPAHSETGTRSRPGWSIPTLRSPAMRAFLFLGRMSARRLNQRIA